MQNPRHRCTEECIVYPSLLIVLHMYVRHRKMRDVFVLCMHDASALPTIFSIAYYRHVVIIVCNILAINTA